MTISSSQIAPGDKVLVTCDDWFYAPDGKAYRAVFGTVHAPQLAADVLGVQPNMRSANWYLTVGKLTIAGCRIHYVLKSDTCALEAVDDQSLNEGSVKDYRRASHIYNADA